MIAKNLSYIMQTMIADKANNKTSEFIVLSKPDFTMQDWIYKPKFIEFTANGLGDKPIDYLLKKTVKGNEDEGRKTIVGKALHLTVDKELVSIGIYTQKHGQAWQLSHTHTIDKALFEAYVRVVQNDKKVSELEKENRAPENFSLNLE
jgi:hypothetical protein